VTNGEGAKKVKAEAAVRQGEYQKTEIHWSYTTSTNKHCHELEVGRRQTESRKVVEDATKNIPRKPWDNDTYLERRQGSR